MRDREDRRPLQVPGQIEDDERLVPVLRDLEPQDVHFADSLGAVRLPERHRHRGGEVAISRQTAIRFVDDRLCAGVGGLRPRGRADQ